MQIFVLPHQLLNSDFYNFFIYLKVIPIVSLFIFDILLTFSFEILIFLLVF